MIALTILYIQLFLTSISFGDECANWAKQNKILPGVGCMDKCLTSQVGFGSFMCRQKCDDFCKLNIGKVFIFHLSDLYPGLTEQERALAVEYPTEAAKAYQLSWQAEKSCAKIYGSSRTNDESDACRHFTWAAFLTKSFGKSLAQKFLDAHEQEPVQPAEQKAMDLANNQRGVTVASDLIENGSYAEEKIIEEFKKNLSQGKIIILSQPKEIKK